MLERRLTLVAKNHFNPDGVRWESEDIKRVLTIYDARYGMAQLTGEELRQHQIVIEGLDDERRIRLYNEMSRIAGLLALTSPAESKRLMEAARYFRRTYVNVYAV
ncbi:hypothetical protein HYY70_00845 [Candidatus Woesearchaeota archaeon]|nr:hypothetical protein [Candidatus Woesearchaeota archaeon]